MNSLSSEAISSVVGTIYQAAYDPGKWETAVERLHTLLDCSRACVARTDSSPWQAIATVEDEEFHSSESHAAHTRDPYLVACLNQTVGTLFRRHDVVDEAQFRRRELWNEWMRPRDMWQGITCNLHNDDSGHWSLHVHRGKGQNEFSDQDVLALRICVEHMIRAKDISRDIHNAAGFGRLFEQLPLGVALVDGNLKVEFLNGEAERLLSMEAPIAIKSGRLQCRHQHENAKLAALVASAVSNDYLVVRGGTFVIEGEPDTRQSGAIVSVAPFNGPKLYGLPSQASAIVILRDIFLQPSMRLDAHMRDLFGLTAAEASLSLALAGGLNLQEAAGRNGITVKTARTYLERIFSKTATRQQSQLVALIKGARPLM